MLETDNEVVGIAHDDHVARGLAPSPALGPKIKDVVQVDVGKQRRDHRALPRPPLTDRHDPFFQDAHLEPFLDQADNASVADPMFQEANQPLLADFVEERSEVSVLSSSFTFVLSIPTTSASSASCVSRKGRKPVREPEEVFLVDRIEHRNRRPLDDLVL